MRLNSFGPIRQETADFVEGFLGRNTGFHPVTPLGEPGRGFGPEHQQGINPQRGGEPIIARKAFLPYRALQVVERCVGHVNLFDPRQFHAASDVLLGALAGEPRAQSRQIAFLHVQSQRVQRRQHAAAGLGNRRVLEEQGVPNQLRLGGLGERPEFVMRQLEEPHGFGDQIMIH